MKNVQLKVKVYYSVQKYSSIRLASFNAIFDLDSKSKNVPISLKECIWAICSSSPDIICRNHDLAIYIANYEESTSSCRREEYIWEGQGLLSWIMESEEACNKIISGKLVEAESTYIAINVELHPTLKWLKDDFYSALKSQNFDNFRNTMQLPTRLQSCNCGIDRVMQQNTASTWQNNDVYSSPSSYINGADNDINSHLKPIQHISSDRSTESEFDRYLKQKQKSPVLSMSSSPPIPSLSNLTSNRLPPPHDILNSPPPQIVRPEPVIPHSSCITRVSAPLSQDFTYKQTRLVSPTSHCMEYSNYSKTYRNGSEEISYEENNRASSKDIRYFTDERQITEESNSHSTNRQIYQKIENEEHLVVFNAPTEIMSLCSIPMNVKDPDACSDINLDTKQPQSSLSTSSKSYDYYNSDAPAIIPVVYAPSNKKRKKSSPIICTEASSTDIIQQTQGISTAIRTYYEVDRNDKGDYILPVEIDSWTVVDLGIVFWDRPAYHNQRYIYPVNYTVRKWYRSMVDPKSDTQYTCRILENGREPKFEVTADDCPITYSGPTPTTVWTIIVRRAFAIRNQEYGHNPVGPDFFGLRKNTIAKMIQDLRNAEKCSQYVWQTFEPARFNKPGRNRRRTDSTFSSGLCGGVNYSLTSNRVSNNSSILFTPRYTVSAAGSSKIVNESKPQTLKIEETTPASMEHNIFPPNNSTSMAQIHHSTPLSSPLPLPSIKIA